MVTKKEYKEITEKLQDIDDKCMKILESQISTSIIALVMAGFAIVMAGTTLQIAGAPSLI